DSPPPPASATKRKGRKATAPVAGADSGARGTLVVAQEGDRLARMEAACRSLAQARNVETVKEVRDRAPGFAHYAREQKLGRQAEIAACEIRVRVERRIGQLLAEMPGKGRHGGDRKSSSTVELDQLGITKQDSHRWQKMAQVEDSTFEKYLSET